MTAAGSPGVRRSRPKTTRATTIMTGMVAASRRIRRGSSYLGDSEGGFAPLPKPPPMTDCAGQAGARTRTIQPSPIGPGSSDTHLGLDRDVPVQAGREGQHTLHVLPVRGGLGVLAPRDVGHLVEIG